jgi:hypothetical protein
MTETLQTLTISSLAFQRFIIMFGPRFQNWDLRIRPLGGFGLAFDWICGFARGLHALRLTASADFKGNPMFKSKIANSGVQSSKIAKKEPRLFVLFPLSLHILWPPKGQRRNEFHE